MLEMQDAINSTVSPSWMNDGFAWYRAIWLEAAELLDHYGWKWWKKQEPDMAQVHLELVDIWHFGLSCMLTNNGDKGRIAERVREAYEVALAGGISRTIPKRVEEFVEEVLFSQQFHIQKFFRLMHATGMTFAELHALYIGKNVLNHFRQANGYKEGTYVKTWDGLEDNQHLERLMKETPPGGDLMGELTKSYENRAR